MKRKKPVLESGEVMIESLIVYLVTFTLLFMVLALMMITYQKFTINTVASDVAVKMAQNIRFSSVDIADGEYSKDDLTSVSAYRYLFGKESDLRAKIEKSGIKYATNRLMKTTFKGVVTKNNTDISVKLISDGPALRHITVTVKGEYKLPFDEMLDFFGLSKIKKFEAVESAECIDILDYVNYIDFSKNIVDTIYGDFGKIGSLVDKVWKIVSEFMSH